MGKAFFKDMESLYKRLLIGLLWLLVLIAFSGNYIKYTQNREEVIEQKMTSLFNDVFVADNEVFGMIGLTYLKGHFMSAPDSEVLLEYSQDTNTYYNYAWTLMPDKPRNSKLIEDIVNKHFSCKESAIYLRHNNYFMRLPSNTLLDTEIEKLKKRNHYAKVSGVIYVSDVTDGLEESLKALYEDLRSNGYYFTLSVCGVTRINNKEKKYIARLTCVTTFNVNKEIDITYFN